MMTHQQQQIKTFPNERKINTSDELCDAEIAACKAERAQRIPPPSMARLFRYVARRLRAKAAAERAALFRPTGS